MFAAMIFIEFWRLDCPVFLRALKTGQTKRRDTHLDGDALNVRF
jgi:hypothetical protein